MNILQTLGYNQTIHSFFLNVDFIPARVMSQFKDKYLIGFEKGFLSAEITGNMRFSIQSVVDLPVVGDWVAIAVFDDLAIIHKVMPRKSILTRKAVDEYGQKQPIAANIDFALIVQSVDRDFNLNRLERYASIAHSADIEPWVVLNKTDLIPESEREQKILRIKERLGSIRIITTSIYNPDSLNAIKRQFIFGKTYCLLGSSGVGKSSLVNAITNRELNVTREISVSTGKGKHTTTNRELFIMENGGVIIDNPGMREVGITDDTKGIDITFDQITKLSNRCHFKDCRHINELGCAVLKALDQGELDEASLINYRKMVREAEFFSMSEAQKRQKDRQFGKMCNQIMKNVKKGR